MIYITKYFKTRNSFKYKKGIIDQVILLDKFSDILQKQNQEELKINNTIFIPHRSFSVYVPYDMIENDFYSLNKIDVLDKAQKCAKDLTNSF